MYCNSAPAAPLWPARPRKRADPPKEAHAGAPAEPPWRGSALAHRGESDTVAQQTRRLNPGSATWTTELGQEHTD
eukprot:13899686-Alexandrium_andersonii.AAC.1